MRRKDYEQPTMQVVQLEHQAHLLAGSEKVSATMDSEWEEEDV